MLERRSALYNHRLFTDDGGRHVPAGGTAMVTIAERRPLSILQVSAFAATIEEAGIHLAGAIEIELPAANRWNGDMRKSVRTIGPGIWQIVGEERAVPQAALVRATLAGMATVVDLSHARTALHVAGPAAARTLAKHCGLDLHPLRFPTGSATNTRFGHLGMTLARLDDAPTFEVLVFRGYAEFVFEALAMAAEEFGLQVIVSGA